MSRTGRPRKPNPVPPYKGGHTRLTPFGYVLEEALDHPSRNTRGFVLQHRLVMEDMVGRYLTEDEVVHHIDRNPMNNSPSNLELHTNASHIALHRKEDGMSWSCKLTEAQVREALQGRTTLEAARSLGVHHQTLRNRFDFLLSKRRTPCNPFEPSTIELVRLAASDSLTGYREFAMETGIASQVAKAICGREGFVWLPKTKRPRRRKTTIQPA